MATPGSGKAVPVRKLVRPPEPAGFQAKVRKAFERATAAVCAGDSVEFPALWSQFKHVYAQAQHGKCGFCEGQVLGLHYGDVEHFRPKAEVKELVDEPEGWGQEQAWESRVKGRETKPNPLHPGYWWLAYRWDNYLLSCQACNQQWKGNLFPVDGTHVLLPTTANPGAPLLLSPFDDFEPADHFEYGRRGEMTGLTPQGRATVLTCGLDRPSLRLARQGLALATHEHLDEMASGDLTEAGLLRILRALAASGADERTYCGMVRTIFQQRARRPWSGITQLMAVLQASGDPHRTLCDC